MKIDELLAGAGGRVAEVEVEVPEPRDVIARHDRRRRRTAWATMTVPLVFVAAIAVAVLQNPSGDQQVAIGTDDSAPATGANEPSVRAAVWPSTDRQFDTPEDLGQAFATEVLDWDPVDITRGAEVAHGVWITLTTPGRDPLNTLAATFDDGRLAFLQIGQSVGMGWEAERPDAVPFLVPTPPEGTTTVRWWARVDDQEFGPVDVPFPGDIPLPGSPASLPSPVLVVYLDAEGRALGAAGGANDPHDIFPQDTRTPSTTPESGIPPAQDSPSVALEVIETDTLHITTSPLVPAEKDAWLQHEVTIENNGDDTVTIPDHRTSEFLGDREVIVADPGCGFGPADGGLLSPGVCDLYNDHRTLAPGESTSFTISLWRDLPGMNPVGDAPLERVKTMETRVAGEQMSLELRFTYRDLHDLIGNTLSSSPAFDTDQRD